MGLLLHTVRTNPDLWSPYARRDKLRTVSHVITVIARHLHDNSTEFREALNKYTVCVYTQIHPSCETRFDSNSVDSTIVYGCFSSYILSMARHSYMYRVHSLVQILNGKTLLEHLLTMSDVDSLS